MRGTTPRREQGMADPVLASMVRATGQTNARHYMAATPQVQAYRDSWVKLAPYRDGEVSPQRTAVDDPAQMAQQIKAKAMELGATMVGICRLQPHMIDLGEDVPHEFVIVACVAEDYEKVVQGANAVEEEAMRTYAKCTEIATALAAHVRADGISRARAPQRRQRGAGNPDFLPGGFRRARAPRQLDQRKIRRQFSSGLCHHRFAPCGRSAARVRRPGLLHELQRLPAQLPRRRHSQGACGNPRHQALAHRSGEMLPLFAPARRVLPPLCRCLPLQREVPSGNLQEFHEGAKTGRLQDAEILVAKRWKNSTSMK